MVSVATHTATIAVPWVGVLAALMLALLPASGGASPAAQDTSRAYLGPPGPWYATALAVAPGWPQDGVIVAIRTGRGSPNNVRPRGGGAKDLVRTQDGGRTWEELPVPFDDTRFLVPAFFDFAPAPRGGRLLFLLLPDGLMRSSDDGTSWETVLDLATDEQARFERTPSYAQLRVSPTFEQDQLAFLINDGRLYRTRDSGLIWEPVDVPTDRRLGEVQFSPDFAHDHLVLLAGASEDDLDTSLPLGIVESRDGGMSWSASMQELENERGALPGVSDLTFSPTFAQDGTLFAVARGITAPGGCFRPPSRRQAVLIRSTDRGATWQIVSDLAEGCGQLVRVGLSEAFATDGIGLVALASGGPSPASSNCRVLRTETGGEQWTPIFRSGGYQGCSDLHVVGSGQDLTALLFFSGTSIQWLRSADSGLTWQGFAPPAGSSPSGLPQPIEIRGATTFLGRGEGIWAIGPAATATNGGLACREDPVAGFARVSASPLVRAILGCALEPERPVQVRMQTIPSDRGPASVGYWTEDDNPYWFQVFSDDSVAAHPKTTSRAADQWPAGEVTLVSGVTERFEGGTLLWLQHDDGSRVILAFLPGRLRRFPD
jgi:photosystem II stability/assembly factor-like uncharacterized protein